MTESSTDPAVPAGGIVIVRGVGLPKHRPFKKVEANLVFSESRFGAQIGRVEQDR